MMSDGEKASRTEALTEFFAAYGQALTDERLKSYGNITQAVPIEIFKSACRRAAATTQGSFPPGPGDVIEAALELDPGERSPSHGFSKPRWHRKALQDFQRLSLPAGEQARQLEGGQGQQAGPPPGVGAVPHPPPKKRGDLDFRRRLLETACVGIDPQHATVLVEQTSGIATGGFHRICQGLERKKVDGSAVSVTQLWSGFDEIREADRYEERRAFAEGKA